VLFAIHESKVLKVMRGNFRIFFYSKA